MEVRWNPLSSFLDWEVVENVQAHGKENFILSLTDSCTDRIVVAMKLEEKKWGGKRKQGRWTFGKPILVGSERDIPVG